MGVRQHVSSEKSEKSRLVYLCGSMEESKDGGKRWRERITPSLEEMGFVVFDPVLRDADVSGLPAPLHKEKLAKLKEQGKWDEFLKHMAAIRDQDLTAVSNSLFIIALVPDSDGPQIGGTVHELAMAWERKIPVLWKVDGLVSKVNSWTLSLLLENGIRFDTWESLLDYVKKNFAPKETK
jgi:hypothetical protein